MIFLFALFWFLALIFKGFLTVKIHKIKLTFYDLGKNTRHFSGEMNCQKLGLGQSEVTPVEMEIAKSAKQESRGFSHERFNLKF